MVVIRGYHATKADNYEDIVEQGLEPRKPCEHNYSYLERQPEGVYVALNPDPSSWWAFDEFDEYFEVAYCGPMLIDQELTTWSGRAVIIQERIPPENILYVSKHEYQERLLEYAKLKGPTRSPEEIMHSPWTF